MSNKNQNADETEQNTPAEAENTSESASSAETDKQPKLSETIEDENTEQPDIPAENDETQQKDELLSMKENIKAGFIGLSQLKTIVAGFFDKIGLPDYLLVRFIAVFFFFSAYNIDTLKNKEVEGVLLNAVSTWKEYTNAVKGPLTFLLMLFSFIILSTICYFLPKRYRIFDQIFAIGSILYFDITLLWRTENFNLSLAVMMVSSVFIYYSMCKIKSKKLFNKIPWWVCGLIVLAAAVMVGIFIGITTVCRHRNFGTACHDFGLFVQMYNSLIKDGTAVTTCERDVFMSHFRIHASYIYYTLVPFYKMFPKPDTLLIAQAVLTMGGIIPFFLIAKNHKLKGFSLIFMGFAYVFSIGCVAPCYYEFHENAFLPTLLMWLLWAVDKKNYIMFYIMSVLVCIVKEDAPLYVMCIGIFMFFDHKKNVGRIHGIIMALLSVSYMLFITNWLTKNGDGQMMMSSRFSILMIDETAGLKEVVKNVLKDPAYFFSLLVRDDTRIFFFQTMMPLLFIPFFTKKIHRFMLMIPFIVMNLVIGAGYGYAANVGFQYFFGPSVILLYMCIINLDDMGQRGKENIPVVLGAAALIMTMGTCSRNWGSYVSYKMDQEYLDSLDEALQNIPEDASVGADVFIIPHAANRKEIYIFDSYDINEDGTLTTPERFDIVVIPMISDMYVTWSETLINNGYVVCEQINDRYQFYMSPTYAEEEGAAQYDLSKFN